MTHAKFKAVPSDSGNSSETIEMANMQERRSSDDSEFERDIMKAGMFSPEQHDSDDEFDDTEEGHRALLGSHEIFQMRSPNGGTNVWTQVKHIVIEVRSLSTPDAVHNSLLLNRPHQLFYLPPLDSCSLGRYSKMFR